MTKINKKVIPESRFKIRTGTFYQSSKENQNTSSCPNRLIKLPNTKATEILKTAHPSPQRSDPEKVLLLVLGRK